MKDEDQKPNVRDLRKLLARVMAADEGSPELDREVSAVYPSAPPEVSRSIEAMMWLSLRLFYDNKWGKRFQRLHGGFLEDGHPSGDIVLSMLSALLRAQIALAEAALSTDPEVKRREQFEAIQESLKEESLREKSLKEESLTKESLELTRTLLRDLGIIPRE